MKYSQNICDLFTNWKNQTHIYDKYCMCGPVMDWRKSPPPKAINWIKRIKKMNEWIYASVQPRTNILPSHFSTLALFQFLSAREQLGQ